MNRNIQLVVAVSRRMGMIRRMHALSVGGKTSQNPILFRMMLLINPMKILIVHKIFRT